MFAFIENGGKTMIMDLPRNFTKYGPDVYVEDGILKIRENIPFRKLVYELTYKIKGGKHTCLYCNRKVSNNKVTLDHLYPQDLGGPTITNNLLPCCSKCNSEKSNMTSNEYKTFIRLKKTGEEKRYLKTLQQKKEILRKLNEYQIPDSWLSEHEVSSILVFLQLDNAEDFDKYRKVKTFYEQYGYFQRPILIDRNGFLLDGFYNVFYAKKHNIRSLKVVQLDNVEVIL